MLDDYIYKSIVKKQACTILRGFIGKVTQLIYGNKHIINFN